jgi:hypothetical protein
MDSLPSRIYGELIGARLDESIGNFEAQTNCLSVISLHPGSLRVLQSDLLVYRPVVTSTHAEIGWYRSWETPEVLAIFVE